MMNAANISLLNLLQPMMGQVAGGDAGITPEQMIASLEESGSDTEFWSLLNQQLTGMIQDGDLQLTENKDLIALIEAVEQTVEGGEPIQLDPQLMMQLKSHFSHGEPVKLVINEAGEVELVANAESINPNEEGLVTIAVTEAAIDDADKPNPAVAATINKPVGDELPPERQSVSATAVEAIDRPAPSDVSQQPEKQAQMAANMKQAVATMESPEQSAKMTEAIKQEKLSLEKQGGSLTEEASVSEEKPFKVKFLSESDQETEAVKQPRQTGADPSSAQLRTDVNTLQPKVMAPVSGMSANIASLTPQAQAPVTSSLPVLTLLPSADSGEWGQAIGERVTLLINQKMNQAEIRIDPPHLGKLDIQVQLNDDKAVINIQTQQAQTRDLVDNASLRLREFLQEAGYESVDVNVSHREQSPDQQMKGQDAMASGDFPEQEGDGGDSSIPVGLQHHAMYLQSGRIDYFA